MEDLHDLYHESEWWFSTGHALAPRDTWRGLETAWVSKLGIAVNIQYSEARDMSRHPLGLKEMDYPVYSAEAKKPLLRDGLLIF